MVSFPNVTQLCRKSICCFITNPRRGITIAWTISLVLVLVAFIVACVAASKMSNSNSGAGGRSAGFAAVWTALLLVILSVTGSVIMRRFRSALSIGFFLGVVLIMTNQMLILFTIFAERANNENDPTLRMPQEAMSVFAFFLFLVYGIFGLMLYVFRHDIILNENVAGEATSYTQGTGHDDVEQPPEYN